MSTHQRPKKPAKPSSSSPAFFEDLESRLLCSSTTSALPVETPQAADAASQHALLPDLLPWANKRRAYVYGWTLDRSEKPGHLLLRLTTAIANQGAGPLELRGGRTHVATQEVSQRIFNEDGTFTDRLAGTFTYHPAHHHTHFDDFAAYRLREVTAKGAVGRVVKGGSKLSFCLTDSDEFNMNLPNASADGEYFACDSKKQGISVGWSDVYNSSLPDQWIDITNVKPGKYWLEVIADPHNRILESNEKNNLTRIMINLREIKPPKNDAFAGRVVLSGRTVATTGHNNQASIEDAEGKIAEPSDRSSVWWSWTAPVSGRTIIDTAGSSFDTVLSIFTGNSLGSLSRIARNDDDGGHSLRSSRVVFTATKGTTYAIAVYGYNTASGRIHLNINAGV